MIGLPGRDVREHKFRTAFLSKGSTGICPFPAPGLIVDPVGRGAFHLIPGHANAFFRAGGLDIGRLIIIGDLFSVFGVIADLMQIRVQADDPDPIGSTVDPVIPVNRRSLCSFQEPPGILLLFIAVYGVLVHAFDFGPFDPDLSGSGAGQRNGRRRVQDSDPAFRCKTAIFCTGCNKRRSGRFCLHSALTDRNNILITALPLYRPVRSIVRGYTCRDDPFVTDQQAHIRVGQPDTADADPGSVFFRLFLRR